MVACKSGFDFASKATSRIIIQSMTSTPDDAGGRVETWSDAFTVWAIVEPLAGKEVYVSSQLQSRVDQRITIRFISALADTTIGAQFRVKIGSRFLNVKAIKSLNDDLKTEGKVFQQLLCTEGEPS